ncbi:hypothetical protein C4G41_RS11780 [Vibrio parahaemolyticus]|uniref:hypothetical protein n=1 Tax=Vibrio harveyi group TaxID=717610 RepID=UPI00068146B6|nr:MULTISPECIES: hypothetical protein [Vibrio harveyi group]EGQ7782461.1 hypothetical protein [Vibrio parahaemolyticus]EHJ9984715.1 hypothetical protein [Vibrio parahaemolyticus]EIA1565526.1 hypothetical protein [Vibrio parahaemolyticus]EJG0723662.1 hypothetical protein [Vibrio parahaemolyticus]EJG0798456.1 hypothetical protein [Vibrio parahaemolyticus]
MKTLGLRVSPTEVTFSIYDTESQTVVNVEEIRVPNSLNTPEKLKYIRATLLDVLREYEVQKAGIRLTEPTARSISIDRVQIEGVIQETFASSMLLAYYQGAIATIAAKVNVPKASMKDLIAGRKIFHEFEDWGDLNDKQREAVLVAVGAENV